jgi:large subunit ribosomal protein L17
MRHHNTKRKFGRVRKVRNALVNSLALNLIVRGKIKTTLPKAKELRPFIEKLVTLAKKGDLATQRLVISKLSNRAPEVKKLFKTIAPKYTDRKGGYTRILKLGARKSDGTEMAQIEFVE